MSYLGGNNFDHLDMHSGTAPFNKRPRGVSINLLVASLRNANLVCVSVNPKRIISLIIDVPETKPSLSLTPNGEVK
jgi:hypothetical protein